MSDNRMGLLKFLIRKMEMDIPKGGMLSKGPAKVSVIFDFRRLPGMKLPCNSFPCVLISPTTGTPARFNATELWLWK